MIGKVSISVLNPGTQVRPHFGPTNARVRLHLGIDVPEGAGIKVGSRIERYILNFVYLHKAMKKHVGSWAEGRCIAFDDAFQHAVWHNGTRPRVVLIVDVSLIQSSMV